MTGHAFVGEKPFSLNATILVIKHLYSNVQYFETTSSQETGKTYNRYPALVALSDVRPVEV